MNRLLGQLSGVSERLLQAAELRDKKDRQDDRESAKTKKKATPAAEPAPSGGRRTSSPLGTKAELEAAEGVERRLRALKATDPFGLGDTRSAVSGLESINRALGGTEALEKRVRIARSASFTELENLHRLQQKINSRPTGIIGKEQLLLPRGAIQLGPVPQPSGASSLYGKTDPISGVKFGQKLSPEVAALAQVNAQEKLKASFGGNQEAVDRYHRAIQGGIGPLRDFDGELQRLTRQQQLAGDQMRRHGLLTTEFISAAAQGRVTVRELGVQFGGTIAKFGGWTAAAALTYGGLAAITAVGHGAIQAREGITSLQRVVNGLDTAKARDQFVKLSNEFNVPIENVTKAAFEASKVFGGQGQGAVTAATGASLLAAKTAELPEDTATKYLTAVARGYGLQAKELEGVVDTVNQLQNRLGANAAQTLEGVSKSAGSIAAAGGNFKEAAAAIATIQLTTGRTGAEASTALRRSAEIVKRPDRREAIISLFGIDPQKEGFDYFDLIRKGQKLVKDGGDVGILAKAISTPELASGRIIPLLQRGELFKQSEATIKPGSGVENSARRELKKVLGGPTEILSRLHNSLEQLGAVLEKSGIFAGVGQLARGFGAVLHVTQSVLGVLNIFPERLREAGAAAATLLGILGLARRFNTGSLFAEGSVLGGALARDPQRLRRAEVLQGLVDERQVTQDARAKAAVAETDAKRAEQTAYNDHQTAHQQTILASSDPEKLPAAQRNLERKQAALERATSRADAAERRQVVLADRQRQLTQQERDFARATTRRGGADADTAAQRLGIKYLSPIDPRPDPNGPYAIRPASAARTRAEETSAASRRVEGPLTAAQADGLRKRQEAAARRAQTEARAAYNSIRAEQAAAGRSALAGGVLGGLGAAKVAGEGAVARTKNFATAIRESIGPLEGGIIAIVGAYTALKTVNDAVKSANARLKVTESSTSIKAINDAFNNQSTGEKIVNGVDSFVRFATPFTSNESNRDIERKNRDDAIARIARIRTQANLDQGRGLNRGEIERELRDRLRGGLNPQALLAQALRESAASLGEQVNPGDPAQQKITALFNERIKGIVDTFTSVDGAIYDGQLSLEALAQVNQVRSYQGKRTFGRKRSQQEFAITEQNIALQADDPAAQAVLIDKLSTARAPVEEDIAHQRQVALLGATSAGARARIQRTYLARIRSNRLGPLNKDIAANEKTQAGLRKELNDVLNTPLALPGLSDTIGESQTVGHESQTVRDLKARLKANKKVGDNLRGALKREAQDFNLLKHETNAEQFDFKLSEFDSGTDLGQSKTADPVAQARALTSRVTKRLEVIRAGVKHGIKTLADLNNAVAAQNRAAQAEASAGLQRLQTGQGLAASQFAGGNTDEGARLQFAVSQAQSYEAAVRSKGDKVSPDELTNALKATQDARNAVRDYLEQQAQDLVGARAELLRSRTDNPVRQAAISVREAKQLVAFAKTPADRLRAQAAVNNAVRDKANTKLDRQVETLDFRRDIGKLTDQAYLKAMQSLLDGLTKGTEAYRNLRRKFLQARHDIAEGKKKEYELNLGDVKLPTRYEIRRFQKGGQNNIGGPLDDAVGPYGRPLVTSKHRQPTTTTTVTNHNSLVVHIHKGTSLEELGKVLGKYTGQNLKAKARNKGLR